MKVQYSFLLRGIIFLTLGIILFLSDPGQSSLPPLLFRVVASAMVVFGLLRLIQAFRRKRE